MRMKIENHGTVIDADFSLRLSEIALDNYVKMNRREWEIDTCEELSCPIKELCKRGVALHEVHSYQVNVNKSVNLGNIGNNNKVCVAFSGGLDSVYQSLKLREEGYDVILLHVNNLNRYSNGQEFIVSKEFADKFKFSLEVIDIKSTLKGKFKKEWKENPFKNFLIYSLCVDYCIANGIKNISSGDDLRLSIEDSVFDTNVSDSRELTIEFFKSFTQVNFIPVDNTVMKSGRLEFVHSVGAGDFYDSCVGPGRLTRYLHDLNEKKFGVKLDKWCCGSCRKCCSHVWYDYCFNGVSYPQKFLDRCWKKMSIGADEKFYKGKKTLDERKEALLDY